MASYFYNHSIGDTITHDATGMVCRDDQAAVRNGWLMLTQFLLDHENMLPSAF